MTESNHTTTPESSAAGKESLHTPTPWSFRDNIGLDGQHYYHSIHDQDGNYIVSTWASPHEANAAFIVRAANSHDALLAACRAAQPLMILAHAAGAKAGDAEWVKHFGDTLDAMSAAIALAEGGAA